MVIARAWDAYFRKGQRCVLAVTTTIGPWVAHDNGVIMTTLAFRLAMQSASPTSQSAIFARAGWHWALMAATTGLNLATD